MRLDDAEVNRLAVLLAEAADVEIMPRFRKLEAGGIRQKASAADLVTDADEAAERFITRKLLARFPQALVIGEEGHEEDPSRLGGLADADLAFVIDPVDGTFNFAGGVPLFGVMLAVTSGGDTILGIIYDPLTRSSVIAHKGMGAKVVGRDGGSRPCRVAAPSALDGMMGAASWQYFAEPERSRLARNSTRSLAQLNYRCAAHEYRLLASGVIHYAAYAKLMPWDHLAGVLIHREAGGHSALLDGSPYRPGDTSGGLLLAPDKATWETLRRELWKE